MKLTGAALVIALAGGPACAEGVPKGTSYIIQLTSSQYGSGMGEYLVPPLARALDRAGLRSKGGPGADLVATVEPLSDVGAWYPGKAGREWLYTRTVTVGLSPADADVEPEGRLRPWFSVAARIRTVDEDRVDELDCLIALAVRVAAVRYRERGAVLVDGSGCARDTPAASP
jgi:hypothetical protein